MPSKNPIAAVGSVRNFMSLVKEVNFDEIRERAEQAPRILVVSATDAEAEAAGALVFGPEAVRYVEHKSADRVGSFDSMRYDLVIVADPERAGLYDRVVREAKGRVNNLFFLASDGEEPEDRVRQEIVMADPDLAPALGRFFIPFRAAAVRAIIDETSKANAQFAFISNVPSIVPLFGGFISAGADLIVLTKNQIMMAYKLAAVNGRNLHDQTGIMRELAPVVGAGFVWRTVAREATSFLPFLAGTVPKVGIAFAGTYTIGRAVDYYYRFGQKPTREHMRAFSEQSIKLAASIPLPGRKKSDAVDAQIEESLEESVEQSESQSPQA